MIALAKFALGCLALIWLLLGTYGFSFVFLVLSGG